MKKTKTYSLCLVSQSKEEAFKQRERSYIEGSPKIILGKAENGKQQVLVESLMAVKVQRLCALKPEAQAHSLARAITLTCAHLVQRYGNFLITDQMIFCNQDDEFFVWIHPDVFENKVKIFLPNTVEGYQNAVKGLVLYFRLWLKADFSSLFIVRTFEELYFELSKLRCRYSLSTPKNQSIEEPKVSETYTKKQSLTKNYLQVSAYPRILEMSSQRFKLKNNSDSTKVQTIRISEKAHEKKSERDNSQADSQQAKMVNIFPKRILLNGSGPMNQAKKYFPNKTTLSENKIEDLILKQAKNLNYYPRNRILAEEQEDVSQAKEDPYSPRDKELSLRQIEEELNILFKPSPEREREMEEQIEQATSQLEKLLH